MQKIHNRLLVYVIGLVLLVTAGQVNVSIVKGFSISPPIPQGKTMIVTSAEDSGSGTLRQALLDAQSGDTITFDPVVFKPENPATIGLLSGLPAINQGYVTLDASNAGVILDGSQAGGEWTPGIEIASEHNVIRGLQVIHFTGPGINLHQPAKFNTIGGDRKVGAGPLGQGNLFSDNADGISLKGAISNTILGNLIGTDVSGTSPFANRTAGIFLEEGAKQNVIGPDNIIAYNGDYGVDIRTESLFGNTITQNSIHDNARAGINLPESGSINLIPPLIFDFNLNLGTVAGTTCANCTVEIFSDSDDEGEKYEGRTGADGSGSFIFSRGSSLRGPHLTTTATDSEGNTSMFSQPTSGESRSLIIQTGNKLPRSMLKTMRSSELSDNRIGGQWTGLWMNDDDIWRILDEEILGTGLKRVRLAINGIAWDQIKWDDDEFTVEKKYDDWISDIANGGVTITYVLSFWDKAVDKGTDCPRLRTEEEIQRYLDFVLFIVRHFKDRVRYFELWNEPDIGVCFQRIEVEDYVNVAKRVIPVIRQEYPEARIKVGGTMHLLDSRDYFFSIIESDIMPLVDAISWHSGPSMSPEYEYWRDFYYEYPSLIQEIKDTASSYGFAGEYIADELTWWTSEHVPPYEEHLGTYTEMVAAKYYIRGILMHLGMDVTVGLGGTSSARTTSFSAIGNLCTVVAGVQPSSVPLEIKSSATNIKHYGFTLPDGAHLIALWTDGVAVDDDPGVPATLTIPGITDHTVTGIDVLHGFKQQIVTSEKNGDLIISDLLVKDYPIILRVAPTKYLFLPIIVQEATR
jgi:hypothetical protein